MKIYLAGGYTGNLKPFWDRYMRIYLAGNGYHRNERFLYDAMKIYLVNAACRTYCIKEDMFDDLNILESYYYLRNAEPFMKMVGKFGGFMLDSGAFTFLSGKNDGNINWDAYTEEYASFINKYDISLFIELDIDSIVGIKEVERLRKKLEILTDKKPIPVWHKNRGKDYFYKMCDEYPYVAIGGIVTREIARQKYEEIFPWFIKEAHKRGCKIHGLGYTGVTRLKEYHFDSVDSTAWLHGNRGGWIYRFNIKTGMMDKLQEHGRLKAREGAMINFSEWVKFSKYAKLHL